jgi:hypothetical protein
VFDCALNKQTQTTRFVLASTTMESAASTGGGASGVSTSGGSESAAFLALLRNTSLTEIKVRKIFFLFGFCFVCFLYIFFSFNYSLLFKVKSEKQF